MTGSNTTKITIPVEFRDTAASYKTLIASLENELKKVKPGTSVYDGIVNQIKNAKKILEKLDVDIDVGITKRSDISKLERDFSSVHGIIERIQDAYDNINFKDLNINTSNFGELAEQFTEARKSFLALQDQFKKAKSLSVNDLLAGDSKALNQFKPAEITKSGISVFQALNTEIEQTSFKLQQAEEEAIQLNQQLAQLQVKQSQKTETNSMAKLLYGITGKSDSKVADMRQRLYDEITKSFEDNGSWKANANKEATEALLNQFGLNSDILETEAENRLAIIQEAVQRVTSKTFASVRSSNYKEAIDNAAARELEQQIKDLQEQITQNQKTQTDLGTTGVLGKLNSKLVALRSSLVNVGVLGTDSSKGSLEIQLEEALARIEDLENQIRAQGPHSAMPDLPKSPSVEGLSDIYDAQLEAQQFTANLKQSIRHWMSAQQVINMVKDGIRQAYQDIKGLDTAMTNIAVVTDMSVSDLWGKINDYMSIAQQYGVTTQGVYEVSQLYYQQGLSTNEVMAATTETLKMARIAGMDYAEAADAMTVAIRAFKMEMTDAEHVTDVYSKVAAVTASDSEELAVAMSKTASSAESVGSSFENTTAMLAVMIETTRESAQNLGSALKSIISRYGEMKIGLTVDSEGEEIDYNKVDTALKSVGISIKDAQGQFRDFDDVIFELSAKWDSLDKNTQRYIATIMAGNRQQSRFIALVDNWERLEEVATSAQDSEDAGLLQYAKTLDSLDTKLNNIKTSFQEFYMSIFNGPLIGKGLEFINNIIKGFNKLSKFTTILNIGSIISGIKLISTILINTFSSSFSQISASWKQMLNELALSSRIGGQKAGKNYAAGAQEGKAVSKLSRKATIGVSALSLVGTGLSMAGSAVADKNQEAGTIMSSLGSGLQIGTMVGMINPIAGVIAGALAAIISGIASWPSELEKAQQNLEKAKEAANKANIKRAETKQRVTDLESSIEQIRRLEESRFESDEAEQAWIDANNALYEKFPELAAAFQNGTDAIVDLESAEYLLIQAREKAAEAAKAAAKTAYEEAKAAREEKEAQQAEFEAETVTKYGDENNTTSLTLGLKLAEHLQAERNKYKTEYGGPGAVYDSFAFNKVLTSKTQAFSRPYTQLLTSGIDLYNQDMLHWLFGHENLSEEEILNSFINNLEAGTLKFEEGTTADMAVQKFTNGTYKTASDLIASRNSGRRDAENAQYIENQLDLNQAVVEASTLLDTSYYTEAWLKELEGSASLIEESVKQSYAKSGLSFEEFKSQVPTLVANLANSFSELYNNLYAMGNVDEFSSLIENSLSGQITERDFKVNAQQIFGFEDFDTFISNTEDPLAAALNLYYTDFIAELQIKQTKIITALANNPARQLNWDEKIITNLLQQVPDTYYNEIIAFANSIESKIGAGNLSETQATILIEQYAKIWENLVNPDLNLNTEQLASAQQLLSEADLFSITGIQELETGLLKLQINPDIVNSIMENIPIYTANLITEYAQLENKLATNLTNTTDAMKKASQGMELDEALTMASQLGVSIANFDFIDGKWFYKNIEAINNYYTDEANKLKIALESEAARITSLFGDNKFLNNKDTFKTLMSATENQQKLFTSKEKEIYAAFSPYYTDFTKWQTEMGDSLDGKGIATQWAEYFKSLGKEMDNATAKAMEYYNEQSQKEADKAIRLSQIAQQKESIGINEDLITAQQTFAATQGKGLTTDQRYELEKGFGFKDTDFKIDAEGNWELTEEAIQKGLTQLNQAQKNIWVSQIENNSKSALEAVVDLGSKLASGEAGTQEFMDAFGENVSQSFQDVLPTLLYNITNNQDRFGRSQAQIRRVLAASGLSDEEIDEAYNKLIASYKDSTNANVIRYFELAEKALKGIITEAESLEFTKLANNGKHTLTNIQTMITASGIDLVKNYGILIQDIINQDLPWEQIESQISSYYKSAVGELFNSLGVGNTHQQLKGIREGDGLYNQSELTSLLTLASKEQLTVDWDKLNAAAKIDQITNEIYFTAYDFITGTNQAVVDAFVNSLKQGSVNKKIADITKTESAVSALEEGITSIYENILNGKVLFEDIEALFTNAGKTLTNEDINSIVSLQNAVKDGNIDLALNILDRILDVVGQNIDVDTSAIEAAKEDIARTTVQSIISSIGAGSEGALKSQELDAVLGQLNIDKGYFNQYITETYEGLQISSEGLLVIAEQAVAIYGNLPGLATEIVNSLSDNSPLKTWKGIAEIINQVEKELDDLNGQDTARTKELKSQLQLLNQMRAVALSNPDDQAFNFMSFDSTGGALDNFKNFTKTTETGWNFIKSAFQDGSRVAATEFNEFIKFLSQGNMSETIKGTEITFQQLSNAVLSTIDIFGQVDLGAAAKKLNVDMGDIAGAFDGGLDAIARAQVEYWQQFLEYLMGLKKLEDKTEDLTLEGIGFDTEPPKIKLDGQPEYEYKGTTYPNKEQAYAAYYKDIVETYLNGLSEEDRAKALTTLPSNWTIGTDSETGKITVDPPGSAEVDYSLFKSWAETYFPQLNEGQGDIDLTQFAGVPQIAAVLGVSGLTLSDVGLAEAGTAFSKDLTEKISAIISGVEGVTVGEDGSITFTKNDCTFTGIVDPTSGIISFSATNIKGKSLTPGEIAGILNAGNSGIASFTQDSVTISILDLATSYEVKNAGLTINNSGITGPAPLTDEELAAKLGPGWEKDQTVSTEGKLVYKHPSGIILAYDTTTNKIEAKLPEGVEPAQFADLQKVLETAGYTQVSGAIFSPKDHYLTFIIEAESQDIEVPVPTGVKNLDDGWQKGLTNLNNWTWNDIGMFINGEVLSFKYNTKTEDLEVTTPSDINVDNSRKVSDWIKSQGYEIVNGTSFQDQDGYVYSFTLKTKTEDLKLNNPAGIDETGLNVDQIFANNNWVKDEEAGSNTYSKALDGYIVKWNVTAGTIDVVGADGIAPVDDATKEAIIKKALGDNYDSTNKIATLANGLTAKVTISKVDPTYTGGTASISGLKFDSETVEVTFKPITDVIDQTIKDYEEKTITIDVNFNPTTPSGKGETPTKSKNPNEHGVNSQVSDVYNALQSSDPITAKEALANLTNTLGDLGEATLTPEELMSLQELFTLLSSDYVGDDVSGLDGTFVNFASALSQISGIFTANTSWSTQLNSLLTALSSGALAVTLPALSSFFTTISSSDLTKLSLDEMIIQLEKLNELSVDTELILSIASAISTLGAAWATLPTTDTDLTVSAKDNATGVIRRIQGALDNLKDKVVKIDVENDEKPLTIKVSFIPKIEQQWTGNVNDLGSALADGNVTKLLAGASFANKTLVGELGPELAVYNGRYHLLGQNGAEFVNLPSNAIVFNHKQTEGIVKGQTRIRGIALAEGNVSGPAAASGIDGAIAAVQDIIAMWQGILNASAQQLANGGSGGGGGGGTAEAPTAELQEWYNLSREIARLEQEINNILAKRKTITDGREYLRNLRTQQNYLEQQLTTQQQLYSYQQKQLKRQKNEINKDKVWSQFLTVDENGRLRYKNGNETNNGKGALDILADLNNTKNVTQQFNKIAAFGFTYKTKDGKTVTKNSSKEDQAEAVQAFFDQLQAQIDAYDALFDTVQATEQAMAELEAQIAEVEAEVLQNTMDLEQAIYDIIVENAEKAIEELEEYTEKLGEANEAYINGLKESLNAEKEQYEQEKSDEELAQLQRRLSLLRRTGGSATEIAELEQQLSEALKDQYFNEQEKLIEELEKTNEQQIEKLEQQITIQQETLEFQKEAGLIWNEVAEIMSGSYESIQAWYSANNAELISQSTNQLSQAIEEFAKMVGIYTEDRDVYQVAKRELNTRKEEGLWADSSDKDSAWKGIKENRSVKEGLYNMADEATQKAMRSSYEQAYMQARMEGKSEEEAHTIAMEAFSTYMDNYYASNAKGKYHWATMLKDDENNNISVFKDLSGKQTAFYSTHKEDLESANKNIFTKLKAVKYNDPIFKNIKNIDELEKFINNSSTSNEDKKKAKKLRKAYNNSKREASQRKTWRHTHGSTYTTSAGRKLGYFKQGGLVDYTGPAMVHGTPSKPEAFLNAKQTAMISDAVRAAGEGNVLDSIRATLANLDSSIRALVTNNVTTQSSNITVAPGAVVLNVAKLNDSYDIEELSNDIMNRMVNIASKATNRGVNRR